MPIGRVPFFVFPMLLWIEYAPGTDTLLYPALVSALLTFTVEVTLL